MTIEFINFLARWGHVLFGIVWIGMLYYFNFVQGGYFKEASAEGLADAKAKLAPSALWWFRWGAMFTFITGLYLLHSISSVLNNYIIVGAAMGTLMAIIVTKGYSEDKKTATFRKKIESLPAKSYAKIEMILEDVLAINNLFNVSFFDGNQLFEKSFEFRKNTINEKALQEIPLMNLKGILKS